MIDVKALAAAAQAAGALTNQTVAVVGGGGNYTPPAAGACKLRLIAYIEIGKHEETFQGVTKQKDKVLLVFELSGKNHPPTENEDGTKTPVRITIEESLSLNEKARFFKLFTRMNYAGKATHMAELVGEAYMGTVIHRKYAKRGEPKDDPTKHTGIDAELYSKADSSYTIKPPRSEIQDEEGVGTGEFRVVPVDPAISQLKVFFWNHQPDLEQWNSLFIEGEYPERKDDKGIVTAPAKSKNILQNRIRLAKNFKGSPVYIQLATHGKGLDIPDAESGQDESISRAEPEGDTKLVNAPAVVPQGEAAVDALNDIV